MERRKGNKETLEGKKRNTEEGREVDRQRGEATSLRRRVVGSGWVEGQTERSRRGG